MNSWFCQQQVGLAYPGRAWRVHRGSRRTGGAMAGSTAARLVEVPNEPWRRISGLTVAVEATLTAKERKRGLRRLVRFAEKFVRARLVGREAGAPLQEQARRRERTGCERPQPVAPAGAELSAGALRPAGAERLEAGAISVCEADWAPGVRDWERARNSGVTVEALCARLGISAVRLSRLLLESCGLSAAELVEGCRVARVRGALIAEFRREARELWSAPGSFAHVLAADAVRAEAGYDGDIREWWRDAVRRREELLECVRRARREGEGLAGLACRLGFCSVARLKAACLNVLGKALETLERELARDVVEFYLAAEEREFYRLAGAAEESRVRWRARYFVSGDPEVEPAEPLVDRGSFYWEFKRAWVEAMWREFG